MNKFNVDFKPISGKYTKVNFEHGNIKNDKIILVVGDTQLESVRNYNSIAADILDLATAIYTADRICKERLENFSREIHINLPLRLPQIFQDSVIVNLIDELLTWTTGSYWNFSFSNRKAPLRKAEQVSSSFDFFDENSEVALWSGGLDALAGLYGRSKEFPRKHFYLVGTGSNKPAIGKQKQVRNSLPKGLKDKTSLFQIPIWIEGVERKNKNFYMRSRGVVFALVGAVVSFLHKKDDLYVYENGIGAFNLPYTKAGIGLYHSRSVHPITLHKTSELLSHLFKRNFNVKNPFIFTTKAKMLQSLSNDANLVSKTISCDRPHRKTPNQCGYCSSCILRRQAIKAAHITDNTNYLNSDIKLLETDEKKYFTQMTYQVNNINDIFNKYDSIHERWRGFSYLYPIMENIVELFNVHYGVMENDCQIKILKLYKDYVKEWKYFEALS